MYSKSDPQVSFFQHLKNNNITSANIKSKFSDAKKKIIFLQRAHYYFAINSTSYGLLLQRVSLHFDRHFPHLSWAWWDLSRNLVLADIGGNTYCNHYNYDKSLIDQVLKISKVVAFLSPHFDCSKFDQVRLKTFRYLVEIDNIFFVKNFIHVHCILIMFFDKVW